VLLGLRAVCPVSNLPAQLEPRSQITAIAPCMHTRPLHDTPKCHFFRAGGGFPPRRPRVYSARQHFSAPARSTAVKPGLCVVFLPAIGAFQRHSTQQPRPPLLPPFRCRPAPAVPPSG
jgi:hypothetical protein